MTISLPVSSVQGTYYSLVVAVCDGYVYLAAPTGDLYLAGGQTVAPMATNVNVSMAYLNLAMYFVDGGATIKELNLTTQYMVAYAATAGTAPTYCCLCCNWRGRLVIAGDPRAPQNFYMARVGVPTDWDYSQTDPAAAVAGNLSNSGQIGEPITCLIPYTDDYMLIGCTNSIWMLEGDPADHGTIVRVSDKIGIAGSNGWTIDPVGTLYFVATGGLYSVRPIWEFYQPPQLLSDKVYDQFFAGIDYNADVVSMVWDTDFHYLRLFVTPNGGSTQGTHLVWDSRNGGFWPQQYPTNQGPNCSILYLANSAPGTRVILLGGFDGHIRSLSPTALTDDGATIQSSITLGPVKPDPGAALLNGVTVDLGEVPSSIAGGTPLIATGVLVNSTSNMSTFTLPGVPMVDTLAIFMGGVRQSPSTFTLSGSTVKFNPYYNPRPVYTANYAYQSSTNPDPWNVDAQLASGPDAYSVTEGLPHNSAVVSFTLERRQKTARQRLRGGWFSLTLSNTQPSTLFSFESAALEFVPAGRNRERR